MIFNYTQFINEKSYTHKNLSERFWNDYEFDDSVRKKLIKLSKDFFEGLGLDFEIEDVKLTGSLCNFNYTDHSDLDVHIIVNFENYDDDKEVLRELLRSKSFIWNLKHDINIRGADVEMYVQDINEDHKSTGLFSLLNNEWAKKPEYTDPEVDENDIKDKYNRWAYTIEKLESGLNDKTLSTEDYEDYYKKIEQLKKKLLTARKKGLHEGKGEYSVENIVYKKLRNNKYVDKLFDLGYETYDNIFSQ